MEFFFLHTVYAAACVEAGQLVFWFVGLQFQGRLVGLGQEFK